MVSKDSWSEDEIKGMSDLRLNNYYKLIYYIPYLGNRILCEDIRKISVYDR